MLCVKEGLVEKFLEHDDLNAARSLILGLEDPDPNLHTARELYP